MRKVTTILSFIKDWYNANFKNTFLKTYFIPFFVSKVKSFDINEYIKISDDTCQEIYI